MSERLELVTDFATLREGQPVAVIGCPVCGRRHDAITLNFFESRTLGRAIEMLPNAHPEKGSPFAITRGAVKRRWIYLRLLGLEDTDTTTTERERPKVTAR